MVLRSFDGGDCTGAMLARSQGVSNPNVVAQLDEIIRQVRMVCPDENFEVHERHDDAWVFVPTIATKAHKNLCTVWFGPNGVTFDVRSQQELDSVHGRRPYPDADGPTFHERLEVRYAKMKAASRYGKT